MRPSGGNHHEAWPPFEVQRFLATFLPLQRPPNYQLVADELAHRFAFHRDRKSVAAYAHSHFPLLVRALDPIPKPKRRWERSRVGELWQLDSSIHPWWPDVAKQTLLLTVDDHSRKYLAGSFVSTDTTWHHFEHFRGAFIRHGRPLALYTDGLALFGYEFSTDGRDPRSEFQRALTALGVSHLVAPSPQAKGKIDLDFALHFNRRCNADHQIDFLGRSWHIGPTARHSVTVIHHPGRQFWIVSQPPKPPGNRWSDILAKYSL